MAQSERLGLNPDRIARERRKHAGLEPATGGVFDRGRRECFATDIEISILSYRAEDIDSSIDLRSRSWSSIVCRPALLCVGH